MEPEETPVIGTPVTPAGVTPATPATATVVIPTLEELQKKLADAEHLAANKAEEAARHYKKIEAFEKEEKKRAEAQLSKEQLLEKQQKAAQVKAEKADADIAAVKADADSKLLKAAFLLKAKDMGFENPADAFALANKIVKKNDDGDFDEAGIEAALKPLLTRLPIKAQGSVKGTPRLQLSQQGSGTKLTNKQDFKVPRI